MNSIPEDGRDGGRNMLEVTLSTDKEGINPFTPKHL
jgi:hypothetical protein